MTLLEAASLPFLELGQRANQLREAAHGNRTYFALGPEPAYEFTVASDATPEQIVAELESIPPTHAVEPTIEGRPGATTGEAEIRLIALTRIALPPTTHIRANWTKLTDAIAQVAQRFGADELSAFPPGTSLKEIERAITEAGRDLYPYQAAYSLTTFEPPPPTLNVL